MARTRRTYTPEFKAEAIKLVTEQAYSVAEAAQAPVLAESRPTSSAGLYWPLALRMQCTLLKEQAPWKPRT
jgi:hypothetical protein